MILYAETRRLLEQLIAVPTISSCPHIVDGLRERLLR